MSNASKRLPHWEPCAFVTWQENLTGDRRSSFPSLPQRQPGGSGPSTDRMEKEGDGQCHTAGVTCGGHWAAMARWGCTTGHKHCRAVRVLDVRQQNTAIQEEGSFSLKCLPILSLEREVEFEIQTKSYSWLWKWQPTDITCRELRFVSQTTAEPWAACWSQNHRTSKIQTYFEINTKIYWSKKEILTGERASSITIPMGNNF